MEYMKPSWQKNHPKIGKLDMDLAKFGAAYNAGKPAINGFQDQNGAAPKVQFLIIYIIFNLNILKKIKYKSAKQFGLFILIIELLMLDVVIKNIL